MDDAALARRYDRAAWFWEHAVRVSGFTRAYGETLAAQGALGLQPGAWVLDAGCGSGDLALAAARALNHDVTILGVDASARMADRAARRLRSARVPGAAVQGDVLDLPFPDATFDAVMCAFVLEHLTEPQVALREFRRVLKPGAPLFLIVAKPSFVVPAQRLLWPFEAWTEARLHAELSHGGWRSARLVPVLGPPWCRVIGAAAVGFNPDSPPREQSS